VVAVVEEVIVMDMGVMVMIMDLKKKNLVEDVVRLRKKVEIVKVVGVVVAQINKKKFKMIDLNFY
jgi:hypothetical protein